MCLNIRAYITVFFCVVVNLAFSQQTEIIYLSGTDAANTVDWEFYCTDGRNSGKWSTIPVPSNWELQGYGTYNYGHDWLDKNKKLGKEHGLYKHEFNVPSEWKGKSINIVFDGSMTDTEVKINGKSAGEKHQGGFYRFKYNISKLLKYGESNLLEVNVAKHSENESVNRAERQADFWIFGGIYRPVFLEAFPETHISRAAINPKADGSFKILLNLNQSKSACTVSVGLFDLQGKKIGEPIQSEIKKGATETWVSGKFENIKAWNPEWPTLYDIKISLKNGNTTLHEITEQIGFRTVELRKHDGFYINGEKVVFKGVNRHSFWPETGRCLSEEHHLTDIRLMKEMNMNAVRCSHYPPDERFLELCDSLGLFVLDEVTGWQDAYDTIVGPELIKETILKDENHPSVVIWDHGNEGGWDFANEKWFHKYDIQGRPVLYPWLLRNGVDTHHYPEYDYAIGRFVNGNDPFMPTEFLHGLYDGGHGAGLDQYWKNYESSPLHAGGFLWVLADEAVLRTDLGKDVFDSDGNHAPDGILGPHREKEGSFYTIKEIWSPVQVKPVTINRKWDGKLFLENKFIYTNLKNCSFEWKAVKTGFINNEEISGKGFIVSPDAKLGETVMVKVNCENALQNADLFIFTAIGHQGQELYTWSWPIVQPSEKAAELLKTFAHPENEIRIHETGNIVTASVNKLEVSFSKTDGKLVSVKNSKGEVSFNGGSAASGGEREITGVHWEKEANGDFIFETTSNSYPEKITWLLKKNGLLMLEASPLNKWFKDADFAGISFNYPEDKCTSVEWMGQGPYRQWKNRRKGANIGTWEKTYNNTITGESFNDLIYPEFKGFYGNLYWLTLETSETNFTIISETPNLFLQLFKPGEPGHVAGGVYPPFPKGNISFLYEIPAIGTKFKLAEKLGPESDKGLFSGRRGDEGYPIKLWFDFNRD